MPTARVARDTRLVDVVVSRVVCLPRGVYETAPDVLDDAFEADNAYAIYALWDTGAQFSCINLATAARIGLGDSIVDQASIAGVGAPAQVRPVYEAGALILPNDIRFVGQRLVGVEFEDNKAEILIGMDIIAQGEFAICNVGGSTSFRFAYPPAPKPFKK